jgi:hypothetical protein
MTRILCRVTPIYAADDGSMLYGSPVIWRIPAELNEMVEVGLFRPIMVESTPRYVSGMYRSAAFGIYHRFRMEYYLEDDDIVTAVPKTDNM